MPFLLALAYLYLLPLKVSGLPPNQPQDTVPIHSEPIKVPVTVPPLLEKIAFCESRNIATAKNPKSSASGRFQFIKASWEFYGKQLWGDEWVNKNVFDYDDNTELAIFVYKKYGSRPWSESSGCWSK